MRYMYVAISKPNETNGRFRSNGITIQTDVSIIKYCNSRNVLARAMILP
jgi:hypothetical protein